MHVGTPHEGSTPHSGRYAWGSGEHAFQRDTSLLRRIQKLEDSGMSEANIAKAMGFKSTTELRDVKRTEKNRVKAANISYAVHLTEDEHLGATEIGRKMGVNESTVRSWLSQYEKDQNVIKESTADMLKKAVESKKYIDVGHGTENRVGISKEKLRAAVRSLEPEGYRVEELYVEQLGTGKQTKLKVLVGPNTTRDELKQNRDKIRLIDDYTEDNGRTYLNIEKPVSIDSKRVQVNYESPKDGVIELRRGVPDLSLGNAHYAQVRIAVDGTHYLKGMAMYSDNMPPGIDVMFNTNKTSDVPMIGPKDNSVLKTLKSNKENPFGATIKTEDQLRLAQRHYIDENGKKQLSAINIVNEEGEWARWSKTLSSQFLSKQSAVMAKRQLDLTYADQFEEFAKIKSLTNPIVKKKLLDKFAEDCDSKAVYLKAAGLPRQASHVILPFPELKANEIYAPNYRNGERVVLVRFPHGGKFEIPELVVNNNNSKAKKLLGNTTDAVGINPKVAGRLSGADFDGDTVLVIPVNRRVKVDTIDPTKNQYLKDLQDFDPKSRYPKYEGMKVMDSETKGREMGRVSNLITDMTLQNATAEELSRAVKHSMVVIDAEKHELNWKQSEKDFQIKNLMEKYQGKKQGGASTLISRARKEVNGIPDRKEKYPSQMTPEERKAYDEGKIIYQPTGKTKWDNKKQEYVPKTISSKMLAEEEDAYKLTSGGSKNNPGTKMEAIYAEHSNKMKAMANEARKESRAIEMPRVNPTAAKTYSAEVASLKEKQNRALQNKPLERQAQLIANAQVAAQKKANPDMSKDEYKRLKSQALEGARFRVGKKPYTIDITDKEWEAIQANAVSASRLSEIIDNADIDKVRQRSMPRANRGLTAAQKSRIKAMSAAGHTQREIADKLNISISTVSQMLR